MRTVVVGRLAGAVLAIAAALTVPAQTAGQQQSASGAETYLRIFKTTETDRPELLVYLGSELAKGSAPARYGFRLVCFSDSGRVLVRSEWKWPKSPLFTRLPPIPHLHHPIATRALLDEISRCRMTGTPAPVTTAVDPKVLTGHPPQLLVNPAAQGIDA